MHVLLGLLVAALLCYVICRVFIVPAAVPSIVPTARSDRAFAFLSNGFLFYRERGGEVNQLHSAYAQKRSIDAKTPASGTAGRRARASA